MFSVSKCHISYNVDQRRIHYYICLSVNNPLILYVGRALDAPKDRSDVMVRFSDGGPTNMASLFVSGNVSSIVDRCYNFGQEIKTSLSEVRKTDPIQIICAINRAYLSTSPNMIDGNIWRKSHNIKAYIVWKKMGNSSHLDNSIPEPDYYACIAFERQPAVMKKLEMLNQLKPAPLAAQTWSALIDMRNVAIVSCDEDLRSLCIMPYVMSCVITCMFPRNMLINATVVFICSEGPARKRLLDAIQVWNSVRATVCVLDDIPMDLPDTGAIKSCVDILVVSPFRAIDVMRRRILKMNHIKHVVVYDYGSIENVTYASYLRQVLKKISIDVQVIVSSPSWTEAHTDFYTFAVPQYKPLLLITDADMTNQRRFLSQTIHFTSQPDRFLQLLIFLAQHHPSKAVVVTKTTKEAQDLTAEISTYYTALCVHNELGYRERNKRVVNFHTKNVVILVVAQNVLFQTLTPTVPIAVIYGSPSNIGVYLDLCSRVSDAGELMILTECYDFFYQIIKMHIYTNYFINNNQYAHFH